MNLGQNRHLFFQGQGLSQQRIQKMSLPGIVMPEEIFEARFFVEEFDHAPGADRAWLGWREDISELQRMPGWLQEHEHGLQLPKDTQDFGVLHLEKLKLRPFGRRDPFTIERQDVRLFIPDVLLKLRCELLQPGIGRRQIPVQERGLMRQK